RRGGGRGGPAGGGSPGAFARAPARQVRPLFRAGGGRLGRGRACFVPLRALFPAGTLSGAPKIRAMEIIEELEPVRRGVYGGAVGYFGYSGGMDTAIAIRSVLMREGRAFIQAGAGIVADSDPEAEHRECVNKARSAVQAVRMAERL